MGGDLGKSTDDDGAVIPAQATAVGAGDLVGNIGSVGKAISFKSSSGDNFLSLSEAMMVVTVTMLYSTSVCSEGSYYVIKNPKLGDRRVCWKALDATAVVEIEK